MRENLPLVKISMISSMVMKTSWNCSGFRFSLDIEHLTRDSMKLLTGNPLKSDWSLAMLRNPLASSILDKFFLCWSKCISWPSTLVNSIFSKIRFELLKIDYFSVFRVLEFNFQLRSARRWKEFWFLNLKLSQGPPKIKMNRDLILLKRTKNLRHIFPKYEEFSIFQS